MRATFWVGSRHTRIWTTSSPRPGSGTSIGGASPPSEAPRQERGAGAPGNNATGSGPGKGIWSITPPLPNDAHLAGETALKLSVEALAPYTNTVAHLYDILPNGRASLVTRGAIATAPTGAKELTFKLYPEDWVFESGHRIGISLSGSDDNWYSPGVSQTNVKVVKGSVTLPLLRYIRDDFMEGGVSKTPGVRTLDAATIAGATVESKAPPAQQPRPEG